MLIIYIYSLSSTKYGAKYKKLAQTRKVSLFHWRAFVSFFSFTDCARSPRVSCELTVVESCKNLTDEFFDKALIVLIYKTLADTALTPKTPLYQSISLRAG